MPSRDPTEPNPGPPGGDPGAGGPDLPVLVWPGLSLADRETLRRVLEAGVPVVTSDTPAARALLGPGGVLLPADSPPEAAEAVAQRLRADREFREQVVRRGRAQALRLTRVEGPVLPFREAFPAARAGAPPPPPPRPRVEERWETLQQSPRWVVAVGAWGDVFAACGNALAALRQTGGAHTGILYYGWDADVIRFLEAQPWVREVSYLRPHSPEAYQAVVRRACSTGAPLTAWLDPLLEGGLVRGQDVWPAHVDPLLQEQPVIHRWQGARLPAAARLAGEQLLPDGASTVFLLHPVSTQSAGLDEHWPHWPEAIRWLLRETPHTYVLTGHGWEPERFGEHPRLVNRVGRAASYLAVLALAERCQGLLTTSNSLSMWSLIQGLPAVVAGNRAVLAPDSYFRLWIGAPPNRLVPYDAPLAAFQQAAEELLRPWT